jgi:peptidoglycan/LPS O-acetylase OafA/YrhL
MPLLTFLGVLGFRDWTRIAIIGPITLVLSILSYKYLEAPFLNLKDKFIAAPTHPTPEGTLVPLPKTSSGLD